jgi:methionyl-tRNA formyltransferase
VNKYIILSEKVWHNDLFLELKDKLLNDSWLLIDNKDDFNLNQLESFKPTKIFIPHWSHIIPKEIFENYECIVFHMTDLPFGRGGSPLQNLIVRGFKTTKISAIKVERGIDEGDVYLKRELSLKGTATEIFKRSTDVIKQMIFEIIENNIMPKPQFGEIIEFKRRKPEESNILGLSELNQVYDYIRMLDCEGYPHAFIETQHLKIEFTNANFDTNEKIIVAHVRIVKK